MAKDTVPNTSLRQSYDEDDPCLRTVAAIDDEEELLEIIITTDLSEAAIRKALEKIHREDMLLEIVVESDLSDNLVSFVLGLIKDQKALMIRVFSLVGEKTIRLRKLAAQRITEKDCLKAIVNMESNEDVRAICKKKLNNIA